MECHPHSYGLGLSAIRAAAARHALVLDNLAIKVVLGLEDAAKEHPAVHAGVGALEASVVRLYGVVFMVVGCTLGLSTVCNLSVGRVPGCATTCGAIPLSGVLILPVIVSVCNLFCCFLVLVWCRM